MLTDLKELESLLDSWKTKNIDTEMFYNSLKYLVLKDYLSGKNVALNDYLSESKHQGLGSNTEEKNRPGVSGALLKELENWVTKSLVLKESAVGELTRDLFNDYSIYLENLNISEKISRKSFPHSLYFYLKTSKNANFIKYTSGRNSMFTGLELKPHKK